MPAKFTNNAFGTLASSINNTVTTITLTAGNGARFPSLGAGEFFYATLIDSSNNLEIIQVTARSTDSLTVVRGQDGTTARAYSAGDRIELRPVAAALTNMVQLDGNQTIAGNKTFSNTITGSISGNAGTVTDGVYTTGDQTITAVKRFSSSISAGGSGVPQASVDVQTTGANNLTSLLTTGITDLNFRLGSMNGVSGGTTGTSMAKFGLFYLGVGECATIDFRRGSTTTDGSIAFRTAGTDRATISHTGVLTATSFSGSGASLTTLNASNLSSGTVPTARLGTGTASSSTYLRGDQTWAAVPSGITTTTGSAPYYAARAWVNFNGTGTPAIRANGNVSSITDNGTGDFTVNFTTAMPDTNYVLFVETPTRLRANFYDAALTTDGETRSTSAARMWVQNGGNVFDPVIMNVAVFR